MNNNNNIDINNNYIYVGHFHALQQTLCTLQLVYYYYYLSTP